MRKLGCWLMAVAVGLLLAGTMTQAGDGKIPLDKVPAPVMKALKAKYPKAEIVAAEKGDQDGTKVYEFDIKLGAKKLEVSFTPDGKFVGSEEIIMEADLPAKVKDAFKAKYANAKVVEMERAITGEGASAKVIYEIIIQTNDGKLELQYDPAGKLVGTEKVKEKAKEKGK